MSPPVCIRYLPFAPEQEFDETLVIWTGEFGRTPFSEGKDGRDHHKRGFSLWMAGGGVKGGMTHGATVLPMISGTSRYRTLLSSPISTPHYSICWAWISRSSLFPTTHVTSASRMLTPQ